MFRVLALSLSFVALGSCVPAPAPSPAPPPRPVPIPAPAPTPRPTSTPAPVPPLAAEWRDWPLSPGSWAYRQDARGSIALFGRPGTDADFTLRCDRQRGALYASRRGDPGVAGPLQLSFRTSSQRRSFSAQPAGESGYFAVQLTPRDSLLDAMGYSRGRFAIESMGMAPLVLPPWAEILRVVEDCR